MPKKERVRKNVYLNQSTVEEIKKEFPNTTFNGSLENCINQGLLYHELYHEKKVLESNLREVKRSVHDLIYFTNKKRQQLSYIKKKIES